MGYVIRTNDAIKKSLIDKTSARRRENGARLKVAAMASSARNDLLPDQSIVRVEIETLNAGKKRVRKDSNEQVGRIVRSIGEFGFVGAILIRDKTIVDGHARVAAMKALGEREIPAIEVSHLKAAQLEALKISMNRIAEKGEWDIDVVRELMIELDEIGYDLDVTGFCGEEIDIILQGDADGSLDDLCSDENIEPVTALGDLYMLGEHRLLCGDALDPRSYDRILEGEIATAAFADMPYNVKIAGNVSGLGKVKHGEFRMASGEMSDEAFSGFMKTAFENMRNRLIDGGIVFSCIDWRHDAEMVFAARAAGLELLNKCIWDKGAGAMGTFYRSRHEIVQILCAGSKPAINNIKLGRHGRDRSNVWTYPGANRRGSSAAGALKGHPTPKPVELVADAILDVTHRGDIVLDCFMGSGTTILAAEQSKRRAFGIEIDPKYVDLAVTRWERMTGAKALRVPAQSGSLENEGATEFNSKGAENDRR